jgi:predicted MPP superfamily phosphohydrolase
MIIDILSDLHLDFYFPQEMEANVDAVKSIFDPIFFDNKKRETGDLLIIAGDIGHYNHQNLQILKIFQAEYYKHIVCVLGNHDYYLINRIAEEDYDMDSFSRVNRDDKCRRKYALSQW